MILSMGNMPLNGQINHQRAVLKEGIKTTSMEDISTKVLEKIKNILEAKTEKWSDVSRHILLHISKHKK